MRLHELAYGPDTPSVMRREKLVEVIQEEKAPEILEQVRYLIRRNLVHVSFWRDAGVDGVSYERSRRQAGVHIGQV